MDKIAVLGDRDSIYGFAAVGLETCPVQDTDEAARMLHTLAEQGYAVVYITENYYAQLGHELGKYSGSVKPAVLPIPGVYGNTGLGIARVKGFVEKAVGSDILFGG